MINKELGKEIYKMAIDCGFENCGIISLSDLDGYEFRFEERINKIGIGKLFYKKINNLVKLKEQYPWAKSVVICTEWIGKYRYPEEIQGKYGKAFMLSSETVHDSKIYREKMRFESWMTEQGIHWEGGEKYGPVRNLPLRYAAVEAGLGIFRKNNFFYADKGSYYNLEGYLIDKECVLKQSCDIKPCSEKCNLCQKACKTNALSSSYTMNPLSCVSFYTTFGKNIIPPHLHKSQFGDWICGCDDCQDICPYNRKHDWNEGEEFPGLSDIVELLQPENILKASDKELCEKVIPKTADHIKPSQVKTLRRGAKRVLLRQDKKKQVNSLK